MDIIQDLRQRWEKIGQLALVPASKQKEWNDAFDLIVAVYTEEFRGHHNTAHIHYCFQRLIEIVDSPLRDFDFDILSVEFAIFWHDFFYNPFSEFNEKLSADYSGLIIDITQPVKLEKRKVGRIILATEAGVIPKTPEEMVMKDCDNAILGAPSNTFDEYEHHIEHVEYSWVPKKMFVTERAKILRRFLKRGDIFFTKPASEKFEQQAQDNIARSLKKLDKRVKEL